MRPQRAGASGKVGSYVGGTLPRVFVRLHRLLPSLMALKKWHCLMWKEEEPPKIPTALKEQKKEEIGVQEITIRCASYLRIILSQALHFLSEWFSGTEVVPSSCELRWQVSQGLSGARSGCRAARPRPMGRTVQWLKRSRRD